jgi:FkbM family methyltransferase
MRDLVTRLLHALPCRLSELIYHRLIRNRIGMFPTPASIRLRDQPSTRIALTAADHMHRMIGFLGVYERRMTRYLLDLPIQGVLVDVGANIGYYSCLWLGKSEENTVVAFEPHPLNHELLIQNFARNHFESRTSALQLGCSATPGEIDFGNPWGADETGCGGMFAAGEKVANAIKVQTVTLDDFLADFTMARKPAMLKIDTEGLDDLVIAGASGLIGEQFFEIIFYEQNYWRMEVLGIEKGTAEGILRAAGYQVERIGGANAGLEEYVAYSPDFLRRGLRKL